MFLAALTFALVFGLYFLRNNIVISILISLAYFAFVFYRFGKKKFIVVLAFFGLGILIPVIPLSNNTGPTYGGIVIDVRDNYYIFQSKFERYYIYSEENDLNIGDRLNILGKSEPLKITTYESRFDFKQYLKNKGVKQQLFVENVEITHRSVIKMHQFKNRFLSKFDKDTATLVSAFLFNDKDYSSEVIGLIDRNSLVYLFALSGTYLHLLFAICNYLLLLRFSKKTSAILTFAIFLPFALSSFTKIGTLRVFGLYLLKFLNDFLLKKKFAHIELVSMLALFFLIIDYHLVYQEAFYIGFLLSFFAPFVLNSTKFMAKKKRKLCSFLLFYCLMIPVQTSSAGVFIPSNVINALLLSILNLVFVILSMISIVFPIYRVVDLSAKGLIWVLKILDTISIRIPFGNWGGVFAILFCVVFIMFVFYLESVRLKHAKIALLALLTLTTGSVIPLQEPISNCVYFVNVGQGDSIIIKNRSYTVMIDTGGNKSFDMAEEALIPFMHKKKITHLDALILTHDDFDHSGAKDSLIEKFKVKNLLTEPEQFPYSVGDLTFYNLNTFDFEEENDKSLVLSLNFIHKKWLFTGDASVSTEEKILEKYDVDCDILKVGHHGSNSSTSEKFLKAASPYEAIISCGEKNSYGHPHKEIIDRLKKYNVKIRRTDEEGTICYFSLTT